MVSINYVPIPVFETSLFGSTYNKNSGGRKLSAWTNPLFKKSSLWTLLLFYE
jgi:hypothetical protein